MKLTTITKLLAATLLLLPSIAFSQKYLDPLLNPPHYKTTVIHPDIGLSASLLEQMHIDKYGFVWIGSQYGLDIYDGYSVTCMSDIFSDTTRTSMDWIWDITEDQAGNLWVCSSKGLFRFDRLHNVFELFLPNPEYPDSDDNIVYSMYHDSRGIFWLFTKGGLYSFNGTET